MANKGTAALCCAGQQRHSSLVLCRSTCRWRLARTRPGNVNAGFSVPHPADQLVSSALHGALAMAAATRHACEGLQVCLMTCTVLNSAGSDAPVHKAARAHSLSSMGEPP